MKAERAVIALALVVAITALSVFALFFNGKDQLARDVAMMAVGGLVNALGAVIQGMFRTDDVDAQRASNTGAALHALEASYLGQSAGRTGDPR